MIALGACGGQVSDSIRFALSNMPISLDPRFSTDATSSRVNHLIYESLVGFDEAMMPQADLASWERVSDLQYRFTLKDSHYFHNGMKLTATDVAVTYQSVLNPEVGSPHRSGLDIIADIKVIDALTVDFYIKKIDPLFPSRLVIGVMPATLIEDSYNFNSHPMGSGVFRFISRQQESQLILERVHDHQKVEFVHVKNPTMRVLKLLRSEVDLLQNDLPAELVSYLTGKDNINVTKAAGTNFSYIGFNMADDKVGQLKIRKAIAHAINRNEIIKFVFSGTAKKAESLFAPSHWASLASMEEYAYDPGRSREILHSLGYSKLKPLSLVYKTSVDPFRIRVATVMQQQLSLVGIHLDIQSFDWGSFFGDIKAGNFQMYSLSWVGIKSPDIFRYIFHSKSVPPNGANRGRFISEEVDRLISAAESEGEIGKQAGYYQELQVLIHEQLPYVPLWYEGHMFAAREGIENYALAADGNYDALKYITKKVH